MVYNRLPRQYMRYETNPIGPIGGASTNGDVQHNFRAWRNKFADWVDNVLGGVEPPFRVQIYGIHTITLPEWEMVNGYIDLVQKTLEKLTPVMRDAADQCAKAPWWQKWGDWINRNLPIFELLGPKALGEYHKIETCDDIIALNNQFREWATLLGEARSTWNGIGNALRAEEGKPPINPQKEDADNDAANKLGAEFAWIESLLDTASAKLGVSKPVLIAIFVATFIVLIIMARGKK